MPHHLRTGPEVNTNRSLACLAEIFMAATLETLRKPHKPQQLRAISANDATASPHSAPV